MEERRKPGRMSGMAGDRGYGRGAMNNHACFPLHAYLLCFGRDDDNKACFGVNAADAYPEGLRRFHPGATQHT